MPVGPKELCRDALEGAGFTEGEAEALTSRWNSFLRPKLLDLLEAAARVTYQAVQEEGGPLTAESFYRPLREAQRFLQQML